MNIDNRITEALAMSSVEEAANHLLSEDLKSGTKVAIVADPIYGMEGTTGVVTGKDTKTGYVQVKIGQITIPMQSMLLVPV